MTGLELDSHHDYSKEELDDECTGVASQAEAEQEAAIDTNKVQLLQDLEKLII